MPCNETSRCVIIIYTCTRVSGMRAQVRNVHAKRAPAQVARTTSLSTIHLIPKVTTISETEEPYKN